MGWLAAFCIVAKLLSACKGVDGPRWCRSLLIPCFCPACCLDRSHGGARHPLGRAPLAAAAGAG